MTPPAFATVGFVALEVVSFLGLCTLIVQTVTAASMRPKGQRLTSIATGICTIAHIALVADTLLLLNWQRSPFLAPAVTGIGMLPLLWTNAALSVALGVLSRLERDRILLILAALALLTTPPVASALGVWWNLPVVLDVCGFFVVGVHQLRRCLRRRHAEPTHASIAEAMTTIPVGMLVTDGHGGSVFMNDAMRSQLEELGFPTDLGNLSDLWESVAQYAVTPADLGVRDETLHPTSRAGNQDQMLVGMGDGHILSALIERPDSGRRGTRVFTIEVTQLVEAARRLTSANDALERANVELRSQLADVHAIARQAAFLRMRATVHDVIGQRLSILQRYLDTGKVDEESVAQLRSLMDSILHDLHVSSGSHPVENLEDVVAAFGLVDVDVVVQGALPDDQEVSNALVRIVREATTNACQHAQAHTVWVVLGTEALDGHAWSTMIVQDDGGAEAGDGLVVSHPDLAPVREGTGIPGMRRAAERLGGTLEIRRAPAFSVYARIPLPQSRYHDKAPKPELLGENPSGA